MSKTLTLKSCSPADGCTHWNARRERLEHETRPRKEHDKTCRVRFHLNIRPGIGARNATERAAAMSRLHGHLRRHFKSHGAHNIGFFKVRNDKTGRSARTLTGFVNHPVTVTRKDFITNAFKDIKYFNAAMGELAKPPPSLSSRLNLFSINGIWAFLSLLCGFWCCVS